MSGREGEGAKLNWCGISTLYECWPGQVNNTGGRKGGKRKIGVLDRGKGSAEPLQSSFSKAERQIMGTPTGTYRYLP